MNMLANNDKEYFKNLLSKQLDEALKEAKAGADDTSNPLAVSPDFVDQASAETRNVLSFRIRERDGRLARKIRRTLAKLEDGTFGICEECGKRISEGRLKARPIARLCIRCKEKEECEEQLRGL
jgi:DnaK suppressor protein